MKTKSFIQIFVLLSLLLMAGCAGPSNESVASEDPIQSNSTQVPISQNSVNEESNQSNLNSEVVLNMVERLNAGDVEGSLAYFADDAVAYLMGFPPTGIEVYKGKEQIQFLWQDSAANHFKWEVEIASIDGDFVYIESKTWHDFTRELEVAPLEYHDVYQVIDGKIQTYGSWLTEESLARFKPAFTAAMPPEPTAEPFSGEPGTELTVTITGNSCSTNRPLALKAGDVKVTLNVKDRDKSKYALTLLTLDPDKDILDLMVSTYGLPPSWGDMLLYEELEPGESEIYTVDISKGPLYVICWSQPPDLPIGNSDPILVVP
jgi:ketosteroid isomerase-like protein